uniref:Kunitz trypsin inhibitor n=1 Tax=Populus tremula TaxID=113636 RepID=Q4W1C5_POPTN|nr:kunitz trypsin inhibitor [Populus tremula]CAI77734.1 kunitz trypsin inhibitor [Populus tremula]CAI77735.1 kunitz trypsin inhibitor [Populus tremula]CAI77736.1 kunitz trypsin inhibitor [Populus tremula]
MKITKFLGLSFLLFAFAATSFPEGVHAEDPAAVLDFYGREVQAGTPYLIQDLSYEPGDNTTNYVVGATINPICNSDVVLSYENGGLPVTFSPVTESTDGVIREGTLITVSFDADTCKMAGVTPMWKIGFNSTGTGYIVTTGGVDQLNQFMITKDKIDGSFYQLYYCPKSDPKSDPFCESSCVPVGATNDKYLAPKAAVVVDVRFKPELNIYGDKMVSEW